MRKCRHPCTLPVTTAPPRLVLSQVQKLKNSKFVPHIIQLFRGQHEQLVFTLNGDINQVLHLGFKHGGRVIDINKKPKMFPEIRMQQPWCSSPLQAQKRPGERRYGCAAAKPDCSLSQIHENYKY